jgi:predicted transposase YdaD
MTLPVLVQSFYKLYKTKEGNLYELESENLKPDKIIRELQSAINSIESDFDNDLR